MPETTREGAIVFLALIIRSGPTHARTRIEVAGAGTATCALDSTRPNCLVEDALTTSWGRRGAALNISGSRAQMGNVAPALAWAANLVAIARAAGISVDTTSHIGRARAETAFVSARTGQRV